ncbi:MAG: outer membrane beta-barrel protein [Burkholderiaceae bacterium]|jgi:OOP family OmpA-OmpF porin|nr:outer membrane beta-barrel protein [Burkholderiaceae bacterium]
MRTTTARHVAAWLALATAVGSGPALAKSVYVAPRADASPTPIAAYDIRSAPDHLTFQYQTAMPRAGTAATVLTVDADSNRMLIAYGGTPEVQVMNPTTLRSVGTVVATGMTDIAALVVDGARVYALERDSDRLFVYTWDATTPALVLEAGAPRRLDGVTQGRALALDAQRGRLFVGDRSSAVVRYFSTGTWERTGGVDLTPSAQTVTALAFDPLRNTIYAGNGDAATGSVSRLVRFNLDTSTGRFRPLPLPAEGDHVVALAFDVDRAQLYLTTRDSDTLMVFNSDLDVLKADLGDLGDPGPIAIAQGPIGYNLMNFTFVHDAGQPVTGARITYVLCYRNGFEAAVSNAQIALTLPVGLDFVSATGPVASEGRQLLWTIGSITTSAPRVCHQLVAQVSAAAGTELLSSATLSADPVDTVTQTHLLRVQAGEPPPPPPTYQPLGFSVDDGIESVVQGGTAQYRLCFDNLANTLPVANVRISATIPAGARYGSATGPVGVNGSEVTWTIGALAAAAPRSCHDLSLRIDAPPGTSVTLAAAISSDNTAPLSATHATAVAAVPPLQVAGEGGGGSTAPWHLLAGLAALGAAAMRRARRAAVPMPRPSAALSPMSLSSVSLFSMTLSPITVMTVIALATAAALGAGSAQAQPRERGAYLGAGAGTARTDASAAQLEADLAARGYSARAGVDRSDTGRKVFGGWQFNRHVAAELGYVDLGKVTSTVDATVAEPAAFVADVARVHPYSVSGVSLAGVGMLPLGRSLTAFGKAGVFRWDADIEAHLTPGGTPRSDSAARGTDLMFGAGLRWSPARWGVQAEWERFRTDRDDVDLWSLSVLYRF